MCNRLHTGPAWAWFKSRAAACIGFDGVLRDVVYGSNGLIGRGIRTHEPLAELRSQAYAAIEPKRLFGLHLPPNIQRATASYWVFEKSEIF